MAIQTHLILSWFISCHLIPLFQANCFIDSDAVPEYVSVEVLLLIFLNIRKKALSDDD